MSKFFIKAFSLPWYFLIFASYPILALFAYNIDQVDAVVLFRPLIISLLLSIITFILLRFFVSDIHHSAFLTTLLFVLFFLYGHIYDYVKNVSLFGFVLGRHRLLVLLWAGLFILGLIFSYRKKGSLENHTKTLNTVTLTLLIFPIVTIVSYWASMRSVPSSDSQSTPLLNIQENQSLPDVYYIILDSYTRSDVLEKVYGYDNSAFLNELEEMGFYIAKCSTSNYMRTRLSMSSALNMEYLQNIPVYISTSDKDVITQDLIHHSLVRKTLESLGYKTVAFATGFPFNEVKDADLFLEPPSSFKNIREFENLLVGTTFLRVPQDFGYIKLNQNSSAVFRDRTLLALSEFDNFAEMGGPKFVYVHIITPHVPFVFGPHGEATDPKDLMINDGRYTDETYSIGYINQVEFISQRIIKSLQTLLAESSTPPIIIVQGDHGPGRQDGENRVSILNAYYLPNHNDSLYESISPVNSFRIILNEYFNAGYPLIEDLSYRSLDEDEYSFAPQPTSCGDTK